MRQREISQPQASKTFMDASQSQSMSRRGFGGLFLAGLTSAVLVACGGGSDPTGVTESSSSSQSDELLKAYNKINSAMTGDELITIVGRNPNVNNAVNQKEWSNSTESLSVSLDYMNDDKSWRVGGAEYDSNSGVHLAKSVN